jgi:hypothetical protein
MRGAPRSSKFHFDQLENVRRLQSWQHSSDPIQRRSARNGPSSGVLDSGVRRLEPQATSKARRRKDRANLRRQGRLLVEKGQPPAGVVPALHKLHDYRNETYRRGQHRIEVERTIVRRE